jgi:hypothetical protein
VVGYPVLVRGSDIWRGDFYFYGPCNYFQTMFYMIEILHFCAD